MRGPLALVGVAATLSALVVSGTTGGVGAAGAAASSLVPVPTVSVPLPLPTGSTKVPLPTVRPPTGDPLPTSGPGPGDGGGGGNPDEGATGPTGGTDSGATPNKKPRRDVSTIRPMVADDPAATVNLLDDESSPAMLAASQRFLSFDQQIADILAAQKATVAAREAAAAASRKHQVFGTEAARLRLAVLEMEDKFNEASRLLGAYARQAYTTGDPGIGPDGAAGLNSRVDYWDTKANDGLARLRQIAAQATTARGEYDRHVADYRTARKAALNAAARLQALADRRANALDAIRAARGGDLSLYQARMQASGDLGAQIRAASGRLAAAGKTVQGTGDLVRPGSAAVTSPFGMRFHPILHYRKLHTGLDIGVGDGLARAADDGRVLLTLVSVAYGNMTVIDHGTIDGQRITTVYAHQDRFMARQGQQVRQGQPIGVIGSTGYSTGPHLHFEVRDNGAVEDPAPRLQ
ncbi:MAG: M23 family metallopeptidase [Actinomycetes bacterium]